jgi:peptidoglycan hydrolase-like protein with peptidoglycan-binding domain
MVALVLVYSLAPTHLARYLLASELDHRGIEHEGVETLKVNPWTGEASIGPLRVSGAGAQPARLDHLAVDVRLTALLRGRVMMDRVLVRGIDLAVTRAEDTITMNGISLAPWLPDTGPVGAVGLGAFELREGRLVFQDPAGGELAGEIDRLFLNDFRTWEPDQAGTFDMAGRVNDIHLQWNGEARPFAEDITLALDARTEGVELDKVIRLTGPLGLERHVGVANSQISYDLTLSASGRLTGSAVGKADVTGVDYGREGSFAATTDRADVDLDIRYARGEAGDLSVSGLLLLDTRGGKLAFPDDAHLALGNARIELPDLECAYGADRTLSLAVKPDVRLEAADFSGRVRLSVDQLLNVLVFLQSLSVGKAASAEAFGLADWSEGQVTLPKSDVTAQQLRAKATTFVLNTSASGVSLEISGAGELSGTRIATGDRVVSFKTLQGGLDGFRMNSGQGQLSLHLAGSSNLSGGKLTGPIGDLELDTLEVAVGDFGLQARTGEIALQLSASSRIDRINGVARALGGLPETTLAIGSLGASLTQGALALTAKGLTWQASGEAQTDTSALEFARGELGAARIGSLQVTGVRADQDVPIAAEALTVARAEAVLTRRLLDRLLAETPGAEAGVVSEDEPSPTPALVGQVQRRLQELGYDPGPVDSLTGSRTRAAIRAYQEASGLPVDGRVSDALLAHLEGRVQKEEPTPAAGKRADGGTLPRTRLGRFALIDGATLRFSDTTVVPEVDVSTVFDTLEVTDLDTGDPSRRTQLRLVADLHEFTHLDLSGWVAAIGERADLDATGSMTHLQLVPYSAYIAEFGGLHVESGQLSTRASASATGGALTGEIALDLDGVEFSPVTEEDAERLSRRAGVPIDTAVALLRDSEGRIRLTLPLGGTLVEPQVDLSSAVNKAMGTVLKTIFPPTLVVSVLTKKDRGEKITFEPMTFAPGSAELDRGAREYAGQLLRLLEEHPRLSLKVCGRATARDLEAWTKTEGERTETGVAPGAASKFADPSAALGEQANASLSALAVARTRAVRRYLIEEQGATPGRVAECRPRFNAEDRRPPRVDVRL